MSSPASSPAVQKIQSTDAQASPHPTQEAEPQQETLTPAAAPPLLPLQRKNFPTPPLNCGQNRTCLRRNHPASRLRCLRCVEISYGFSRAYFMDPEENLPLERRTNSFFDNLFDTPSSSSRTQAPVEKRNRQFCPNNQEELSRKKTGKRCWNKCPPNSLFKRTF